MADRSRLRQMISFLVLLSVLITNSCGGGGSVADSGNNSNGGGSNNNGGSSSGVNASAPKLLSVKTSQDSSIASNILDYFMIEFEFSDLEGDLDSGTFCMDWESFSRCIDFDESFTDIQAATVQISFSLFYTPPLVGDITVKCKLTDKAGNKSNEKSFSFSQTKPGWPWQWGSSGTDRGVDLAIDSSDRILVLGEYDSTDPDQNLMFLAAYYPDAFCYGLLPIQLRETSAVAVDSARNIFTVGKIYENPPDDLGSDCLISKFDHAGNQIWEEVLSSDEEDISKDITVDNNGNVYITGLTWGDLDEEVNAGFYDAFLAKYDSSGNKLWTRLLGSLESDYGSSVTTDSGSNIYLVGGTEGDIDGEFHPGITSWTFLAKYDSSGNKLWVKQFGESGNYYTSDIVVDRTDNIYVVGSNMSELNSLAQVGFIRKFNAAGELLWLRQLGGESWYAECSAVSLDQNDNIIVTGTTFADATSDAPTDKLDSFIAKYDSSGTQSWFTIMSTSGDDFGNAVAVDSNNNTYVTGATEGSLPGFSNVGHQDVFISKLDSSGTPIQDPQ